MVFIEVFHIASPVVPKILVPVGANFNFPPLREPSSEPLLRSSEAQKKVIDRNKW